MKKIVVASLVISFVCFWALLLAVLLPNYALILALVPCYIVGIILGIMTIGKAEIPLLHKIMALTAPFLSPSLAVVTIEILKGLRIIGSASL
mgnify:FL=1|tara:strand:- start:223 stop:498 length:276 start_codon:yes stop_codon:yes gene_type:complete